MFSPIDFCSLTEKFSQCKGHFNYQLKMPFLKVHSVDIRLVSGVPSSNREKLYFVLPRFLKRSREPLKILCDRNTQVVSRNPTGCKQSFNIILH